MSFILGGFGEEVASALTGGASKAIAYITAGVHAGLSANEIGRQLTAAGMGIRRSNLLTLVAGARGGLSGAAYQRGLSGNIYPDPSLYTGAISFMRNRYGYVVKVRGTNNLTGEQSTQFITLSTPNVLTNDQIASLTSQAFTEGNSYGLTLTGHEVDSVLVDPRFLP